MAKRKGTDLHLMAPGSNKQVEHTVNNSKSQLVLSQPNMKEELVIKFRSFTYIKFLTVSTFCSNRLWL